MLRLSEVKSEELALTTNPIAFTEVTLIELFFWYITSLYVTIESTCKV